MKSTEIKNSVRIWLWIGFFMVLIQILLGGVTRLTGSGLSITKWDIVMGTLPPIGEDAWKAAFELYKDTPQYQKINEGMSMAAFKFIYFWEYFHRLWARIMGFVFVIPFIIFSVKGYFTPWLKRRLIVIFLLACIVAVFGWIMVASGLINRPWVSAYKLSMHLILAVILINYLFQTIVKSYAWEFIIDKRRFVWSRILSILIFLQIFIGGMVSGMKAALLYPTFPDMKGEWFPKVLFDSSQWNVNNFINYEFSLLFPTLVHTVHRYLAYIIMGILIYIVFTGFKRYSQFYVSFIHKMLVVLLSLQIALGIITVLKSIGQVPVFWGVFHQINGILLFVFSVSYSNVFKKI